MITKLFKSAFFKPAAILMAFAVLSMSFTYPANAEGTPVVVKSGTMVNLELTQTVDGSDVSVGDQVSFRVTNDIKVDGKVVIKAGTMARGQVSNLKTRSLMGIPGKVSVSPVSVQAVDGTNIYFTQASITREGDSRLVGAIILTCCCIFGFLIKGKGGEIASGTTVQAAVASDVEVNVN